MRSLLLFVVSAPIAAPEFAERETFRGAVGSPGRRPRHAVFEWRDGRSWGWDMRPHLRHGGEHGDLLGRHLQLMIVIAVERVLVSARAASWL